MFKCFLCDLPVIKGESDRWKSYLEYWVSVKFSIRVIFLRQTFVYFREFLYLCITKTKEKRFSVILFLVCSSARNTASKVLIFKEPQKIKISLAVELGCLELSRLLDIHTVTVTSLCWHEVTCCLTGNPTCWHIGDF